MTNVERFIGGLIDIATGQETACWIAEPYTTSA